MNHTEYYVQKLHDRIRELENRVEKLEEAMYNPNVPRQDDDGDPITGFHGPVRK